MKENMVDALHEKWAEDTPDSEELKQALETLEGIASNFYDAERARISDANIDCVCIAKKDGFLAGFEAGIKLALEIYKKL